MTSIKHITKLLEKRELSPNTIKIYKGHINRIKDKLNYQKNNILFLKKTNQAIQAIEENSSINSIKQTYIAIYSIIKDNKCFGKKHTSLYKKKMEEFRDKSNARIGTNQATDKQRERHITLDNLKSRVFDSDYFDNIEEDIKLYEVVNERRKGQILRKYIDYILMNFLLKSPPRRLEAYNAFFTTRMNTNDNNILISGANVFYMINDFKNVKKIGKQRYSFDRELSKLFKDFYQFQLEQFVSKPMFIPMKKGKTEMIPFKSSNAFGAYIKRTFKNVIGQELSMNDLRHIYETELQSTEAYKNASDNERERLHKQLLHNATTGRQYRLFYN